MSKSPKIYTVKWTRHRPAETTERYYTGTAERIAAFCGYHSTKTIRSVLSKWQKELDRRYECTYTRVSVELVEAAPEGAQVTALT